MMLAGHFTVRMKSASKDVDELKLRNWLCGHCTVMSWDLDGRLSRCLCPCGSVTACLWALHAYVQMTVTVMLVKTLPLTTCLLLTGLLICWLYLHSARLLFCHWVAVNSCTASCSYLFSALFDKHFIICRLLVACCRLSSYRLFTVSMGTKGKFEHTFWGQIQ